jgi:hypothetical protein
MNIHLSALALLICALKLFHKERLNSIDSKYI